jgi:hypothetical protein
MGCPTFLQVLSHLPTRLLHEEVFFAYRLNLDCHLLLFSTVLVNYFVQMHYFIIHLTQLISILNLQSIDMTHMMAITTC